MNLFPIVTFLFALIVIAVCEEENDTTPILMARVDRDQANLNTANCVLKLSAKYFVEKKALKGSIVIINVNSKESVIQQILFKTIHDRSKYSVMVKDAHYLHKNASHFPEKAKNYMMILEDEAELRENIKQLKRLPTWNPHAKAAVYVKCEASSDAETLAMKIINQLRENQLLRCIVLIDFSETNEIVAYSWKPYSATNCGGPCREVQILDTCKNNKILQRSTLTELLLIPDMKKCPINVYTIVSEPYVMPPEKKVSNSVYSDEYEFILGIEINLMKIISEITNMSLVIRFSNKSEDAGSMYSFTNMSEPFEKLLSNEFDLIIGNIKVNKIIRDSFDPSCSYMQDDITWCIRKPGAALTWSSLITIFTISTWTTTFAAILLVSLLFHWFKYRENPSMTKWPTKSILMTVGMVLGWGALFKPKRTSFRLLLFSWLLFCINLNTSYQSFLRSFLIHPKVKKQLEDAEEIISEKYEVGGKDSYRIYFEGNRTSRELSTYVLERYKKCDRFKECIEHLREREKFAVVGSRRQAIYQDKHLGKGKSMMYCLDKTNIIYKYGVVILFRKWYPLVTKFDKIIRSVTENGLIWKWNNEVNKHPTVTAEKNDMVPLGMQHMLGAFIFLFIGYSSCLVIFLLEVAVSALMVQKNKKRTFLPFNS